MSRAVRSCSPPALAFNVVLTLASSKISTHEMWLHTVRSEKRSLNNCFADLLQTYYTQMLSKQLTQPPLRTLML